MGDVILAVTDLSQKFPLSQGLLRDFTFQKGRLIRQPRFVYAVNQVSFMIAKGEVFSLVGESGCGKSTTARTIMKLLEPQSGEICFDGTNITRYDARRMHPFRRRMQMIFQNPYASLNPRYTIKRAITEPMLYHRIAGTKKEAEEKALALLDKVGLRPEQADRFPHQFSGGQRQRISIARALAVNPDFVVADEPVSALDVSIQAQILNLMLDLKDEYNLSYLFIAHDLSVVKYISNRVGVMYLGKIVEMGSKQAIYQHPLHPYTRALFAAAPVLGRKKIKHLDLTGDVPATPTELPTGCYFRSRCPYAKPICGEIAPKLKEYERDHRVACHMLTDFRGDMV